MYFVKSAVKQASGKQQMLVTTQEGKSRIQCSKKTPDMQHLELRKENPKRLAAFLKHHQMFFQHLSAVWFCLHAQYSLSQKAAHRLI